MNPIDVPITHYVLAIALDKSGNIALIRKKRPEWQAGFYNGIGGKIQPNEIPVAAMKREFREETGVTVQRDQWRKRGKMEGPGWMVHVFTCRLEKISNVRTMTDEEVELVPLTKLPSIRNEMLVNVSPLISLCRMREEKDGFLPQFYLSYFRDAV